MFIIIWNRFAFIVIWFITYLTSIGIWTELTLNRASDIKCLFNVNVQRRVCCSLYYEVDFSIKASCIIDVKINICWVLSNFIKCKSCWFYDLISQRKIWRSGVRLGKLKDSSCLLSIGLNCRHTRSFHKHFWRASNGSYWSERPSISCNCFRSNSNRDIEKVH